MSLQFKIQASLILPCRSIVIASLFAWLVFISHMGMKKATTFVAAFSLVA
jgi:hypothetical protein